MEGSTVSLGLIEGGSRLMGFLHDSASEVHAAVVVEFHEELTVLFKGRPSWWSETTGKSRRCCCEALVWSNFLFVLPALVYLCQGFVVIAVLVAFSAASSTVYHLNVELVHWQLVLDKVSAILAFVTSIFTVGPLLGYASLIFAVLLVLLAFWFKKHQGENLDPSYAKFHTAWHLSIAVGQTFLACHLV